MYVNCMDVCGMMMKDCGNKYCSAHFKYSAPKYKEKPKGGPGKRKVKEKIVIPKMNNFYFGENE